MDDRLNSMYSGKYKISEKLLRMSEHCENEVKHVFGRIESLREFNQLKVIQAMQDNNLSETHFTGTTGYGYGDRGREVLDSVYAQVFGAEKALVRYSISTGTQAIATCLYALLKPG